MTTALPPDRPHDQRHMPRQATDASTSCATDDRREHLRRMLRVPASLDAPHATNAVQLIDICRAGVAFASAAPLDLGTGFSLRFQLPTASCPDLVSGDVVYCKPMPQSGLYKVGARLRPMGDDTVERIVDFVTAAYIP